jgi:hypothetical protein
MFATIHDLKGHNYRSEVLSPKMEISPDRYIEYAAKDFFYVMVHDPVPPPLAVAHGPEVPAKPGRQPEGLLNQDTAFHPDGGAQPAPTWIPGIWSARAGDGVAVVDVEPGRAQFRIRAGVKEPDPKTGATPTRELADDDEHRVLLAVPLGIAPEKHPRGLATDGRFVMPMGAGATGALVAGADGRLSIVRAADVNGIEPRADLAELPLLLDGGAVIPIANEARGAARAALGTTPDGRVLIAYGGASFAPLADVLRSAGCTRAVALDRGAPASFAIHRAGTHDAPRAQYDETTLSAIAVPLRPRGFRFEPETKVAEAR